MPVHRRDAGVGTGETPVLRLNYGVGQASRLPLMSWAQVRCRCYVWMLVECTGECTGETPVLRLNYGVGQGQNNFSFCAVEFNYCVKTLVTWPK
jgi:hypothetical protein